jgi:hypothetical protein
MDSHIKNVHLMNGKNGLETLVEELNDGDGMKVEFKKRLPDGSLVDANATALSSLNTQASVASTAQGIIYIPI